ncbi:MAG: hypothetical protein AAF657_07440 [Acidobacteriota bacterium]
MGAFYNSICVPGDAQEQVRSSLLRWLGIRGFELSEQPLFFDLDSENERCAYLVSNSRWTLLFFSQYDEERRLIRELQTWAETILYLWVQDSDVWGYDLFDAAGFVASFNSDPRSYLSFSEDGDPAQRPAAEPDAVASRLGLPDKAAELGRIHRLRPVFQEDACRELCQLIRAEPAMTRYDDLERGALDDLGDWQVEQLLFVHRSAVEAKQSLVDLHEVRLGTLDRQTGVIERTDRIRIPPEVLAEMQRRQKRIRLTVLLLRPLSWLARAWRSTRSLVAGSRRLRTEPPGEAIYSPSSSRYESSDIVEVRHLINERHRCRIRLAVGGEAHAGSSKPASVFTFHVGETSVTCTARPRSRIEAVLQQPSRSKILRDEKYLIAGLQARHVVFELPPLYLAGTTGPSYLGLHVIQTEPALYVFLYRFPEKILKEVERAIQATVRSFRLLG